MDETEVGLLIVPEVGYRSGKFAAYAACSITSVEVSFFDIDSQGDLDPQTATIAWLDVRDDDEISFRFVRPGDGVLIFPALHADVNSVELVIDAALRFDFRDKPVDQIDISYAFKREIGKANWRQPQQQM